MADHYEVLQVHPRAEPEVIRAAFRTLARKYHPDFGGDPRMMMELNEAWKVLSDRARRAAYDASRHGPRGRMTQSPSRFERSAPGVDPQPGPAPAGPIAAAAERRAEAQGEPAPHARAAGTVLDFGRYAGWSVAALAAHDPDYLLWLERTPIGRPLRAEISGYMERRQAAGSTAVATAPRPNGSLLRRRPR